MGLALWSVKTTPWGLALWSVKTTPLGLALWSVVNYSIGGLFHWDQINQINEIA